MTEYQQVINKAEIALNNGWIKKSKLNDAIKFYGNGEYSNYLKKL